MAKKLEITLVRSTIHCKKNQIATAKALGLSRINQTVIKEENEAILGMIKTISHLVKVVEK